MPEVTTLLPEGLRNALRPTYQSLGRSMRRSGQAVRERSFWLRPDWNDFRREVQDARDVRRLYELAQREFGVLQVVSEISGVLDFIAAERPRVVGEIGVKHGGNSFLFSQVFTGLELLVGADLSLHNGPKLRSLAPKRLQVRLIEGSSYAPETVDRVARVLAGRRFDFLFIDGDHTLGGVKADLLAYYDFVRPGGLIGFHDIVPDELARSGAKDPDSDCYGGDVYLLWRALKPTFEHYEFVESWDQRGFGIGLIRRPDKSPLDALGNLRNL